MTKDQLHTVGRALYGSTVGRQNWRVTLSIWMVFRWIVAESGSGRVVRVLYLFGCYQR